MIKESYGNKVAKRKWIFYQILEGGYGSALKEYIENPFQMIYTISPNYELANIMTRCTGLAGM